MNLQIKNRVAVRQKLEVSVLDPSIALDSSSSRTGQQISGDYLEVVKTALADEEAETKLVIPLPAPPTVNSKIGTTRGEQDLENGDQVPPSGKLDKGRDIQIPSTEQLPDERKVPLLAAAANPALKGIRDEKTRLALDAESRAEDVDFKSSSFDAMPVSAFGAAMLRGMGWNDTGQEEEARKFKLDAIMEARDARLGLGARPAPPSAKDRKRLERSSTVPVAPGDAASVAKRRRTTAQLDEWKSTAQQQQQQQQEQRQRVEEGDIVVVVPSSSGASSGHGSAGETAVTLIGHRARVLQIRGVPGLNCIRVRLESPSQAVAAALDETETPAKTPSKRPEQEGDAVIVPRSCVEAVDAEELRTRPFVEYSAQTHRQGRRDGDSSNLSLTDGIRTGDGRGREERTYKQDKKDKKNKKDKKDKKDRKERDRDEELWLRAGLRVRIVSRKVDGPGAYLQKATIEDVDAHGLASLRLDSSNNGHVIEGTNYNVGFELV
jgi:hypothetical protein